MKCLALTIALGLAACQRSRAPETGRADAAPPVTASPAPPAPSAPLLPPTPSPTSFSFDADPAGVPPSGFAFGRTGGGPPGRWRVQADSAATSAPHVLAQVDADSTNYRFPMAVTTKSHPANVRVSVSCKLVSGRVDRACGLVLRYRDENNYLITRANALEDNVRLYTVKNGERDEIASRDVAVTPNVWHDYRFEARGEELRVWWDGKLVLEHRDESFIGPGSAGMWTKADSVTYFDDFSVEALR